MRGSRQTNRKTNTHVKEIVELSLRHGLMSRETSYVAVERRETPVLGDIQLRRIPVVLTRGWGDVTPVAARAALSAGDTGAFALGGEYHRVGRSRPQPRGAGPGVFARLFGRSDPDETTEASTFAWAARMEADGPAEDGTAEASTLARMEVDAPADPVQRLIALQRADGAWELTRALAAAMGHTLADLEKALDGLASATTTTRRVWATALAVAWLERNADDAAAEWRLLALKARRWLDGLEPVSPGGRSWLDAARAELAQASSAAPPGR